MSFINHLVNKIFFSFCLLSIIGATEAFSSNVLDAKEVGNGGDAIVCYEPNGSIKAIELLDFYEAKLRKIDLDVYDIPGTFNDKILTVLDRLYAFSPVRAQKYLELYTTFFNETVMLKDIELTDVPDSNHIAIPKGCKVEQLVIQKKPAYPGDKRYTFNEDLWNALDDNSKAGIILHEIIYHEGIEVNNIKDSKNVRYLTSFLFSKGMINEDAEEKLHLAFKLARYFIDYRGAVFQTSSVLNGGGYVALPIRKKHDFFTSYNPQKNIDFNFFKTSPENIGETWLAYDQNSLFRGINVLNYQNNELNIGKLNLTTDYFLYFDSDMPKNNLSQTSDSGIFIYRRNLKIDFNKTKLLFSAAYKYPSSILFVYLNKKIKDVTDLSAVGLFEQIKANSNINSNLTFFHDENEFKCVNKKQLPAIFDIENDFFKVGLLTSIKEDKIIVDTLQGKKNFALSTKKSMDSYYEEEPALKEHTYCTYFDPSGYAEEGPVLKGEVIQTKQGPITLEQDSLVKFLSSNDAIITPINE